MAAKASPDFCLKYCYTESYKFPSHNSSVLSLQTIRQLQSSPLLPLNCAPPSSATAIERKTNITGK